ncbi:MAG: exonuclease subunit SbcD, partial [Clostridia bacterium]
MRFLHLSDLHIGRRLSGISLLDDQRVILAQAAELVQSCDAVLLAGDLYDKAQPSAEAVKLVSDFLVTLSRLNKPVFAISGNHDSPEQIAYCHELLGACG